jgi:hypothetical protein
MRKSPNPLVEQYRLTFGPLATDSSYGNNGAFRFNLGGLAVQVIVSDGEGWDHVSVGVAGKHLPSWGVMCQVKDMFFEDDEVVIQYHPAKSMYVNNHPGILHLWRPQAQQLPLPPTWMVGVNGIGPAEAEALGPQELYRRARAEKEKQP